jgi:antirestriction protein ArdC
MRKPLSAEAAAERAARKEKLSTLIKEISAMTAFQRMQLFSKLPCIVNTEGKALSVRNTILIHRQISDPTMVGGFRQWLKQGRCVRKGEHGAAILFPRTFGKAGAQEDNADGETQVKSAMRFLTGTVFDVGQTEPIDATIDPEVRPILALPAPETPYVDAWTRETRAAIASSSNTNEPAQNPAVRVIDGDFQLV